MTTLPTTPTPLEHARNQGFQHGWTQTMRPPETRLRKPDPAALNRAIREALAINRTLDKPKRADLVRRGARLSYGQAFFRQLRQA